MDRLLAMYPGDTPQNKFDPRLVFAKMAGLQAVKSPQDMCPFEQFKKFVRETLKLEIEPEILAEEARLEQFLVELYGALKSDSSPQLVF